MGNYTLGPGLGATDDPVIAAWERSVRARGGTPGVNWPAHITVNGVQVKQVNAGKLAARLPDGKGGWKYELPPFAISVKNSLERAGQSVTIAAGKAAAVGENVAKGILEAPRNALSAITGIPRWLVPVVGVGVLLFIGADKLGLTGVARRRFASNPRGRRRRRHALPRARRRRRR